MKKLCLIGLLLSIGFSTSLLNGQIQHGTGWVNNGFFNDYSRLWNATGSLFAYITNTSRSMGVYQAAVVPLSQLEVNSNTSHLPLGSLTIPRSEVFSTDAGNVNSYWRMKKFGVEYGLLYSDNNNFNVQATQAKLWLRTGGNTPRILVDDATTNGAVALGENLPPGFVPQSRLHINMNTATVTDLRFTNLSTGTAFADGFRIGVAPTGLDAAVMMLETGGLYLGTANIPRMRIISNGRTIVGLNVTAAVPTNRFVINADPTDPTPSGLQFTDVNSASSTVANPGTGVLALDPAGNVIYVPGGGGTVTGAQNGVSLLGTNVVLGGNTSSGLGTLISNREIPMSTFSTMWTSPGAGSTMSFGIGHPFGTANTTFGRFEVINDLQNVGGEFETNISNVLPCIGVRGSAINTGTGNAIGLRGISLGTAGAASFAIGVGASSASTTSAQNIGANNLASNGTTYSIATNTDVTLSASPLNFGVQCEVQGNTNPIGTNIGGEFIVSNNPVASVNIGIRSTVPTATGGAGPNWAGLFNGDVASTTGFFVISDRNFKKDIKPIENSLEIINQLNPVNYLFDRVNNPDLVLSEVKQWGFISQEIETILPEFTKRTVLPAIHDSLGKELTSSQEVLSLNYNGFIAILTKAIQEQQDMILTQQTQIDELRAILHVTGENMNNNSNIPSQDVDLSDGNYVVLDQNAPNPFAETTSISYVIPAGAVQSQIIFYNALGQAIKTVEINDRGRGVLNVFANDLSSGIYSYSLIIDNKMIDTKKMIKK